MIGCGFCQEISPFVSKYSSMATNKVKKQTTKKTPRRRIRAHYEQLIEFRRGRIIGLKERGWANRKIARHMDRSDAIIKSCCQEWMDSGRFQRRDSSGLPRATTDQEDRFIVRSTVTALDLSLSTIRRTNRTRVSTMTIHRWLIEEV
ncbi:HTH_Tnp_Tc3_2 domain-containing protein [Trichonephila clavipes]|nr:HTH_Tnp_Tc3_2 domain-containing protein [Trichonephila clavipes]